jgi:hypothetical protein
MKFRIYRSIEPNYVKERVPTEYRDLAVAYETKFVNKCTLIVFPHNRKDVVKSNIVIKALSKLGASRTEILVVVGGCFSLESVEILSAENAVFLSLSEFNWTDKSFAEIKHGAPR